MKKQGYLLIVSIAMMITLSACGVESETTSGNNDKPVQEKPVTQGEQQPQIEVLIDQTQMDLAKNNFFFTVKKLPKGYALDRMQWKSDKTNITNSYSKAYENGGTGEKGFYISGDGQFSGFSYDEKMIGEKGVVTFMFKNDKGETLEWKKEVTLL